MPLEIGSCSTVASRPTLPPMTLPADFSSSNLNVGSSLPAKSGSGTLLLDSWQIRRRSGWIADANRCWRRVSKAQTRDSQRRSRRIARLAVAVGRSPRIGDMNYDLARHNMVVEQLERRESTIRACWRQWSGCRARSSCRRELLELAYEDRALPIELEQTISQPYTVAFMCQEARMHGRRQGAGDRHRIGLWRGGAVAAGTRCTRSSGLRRCTWTARERLARLGL